MRTFANCVAVFFIFHFIWSYYRTCYRRGYRIDVWHASLFQLLLVTSIMLPFNRSQLNVIALGPVLVKRTIPFVDEAFLISALGYACTLLGGMLWRFNLHVGLRKSYSNLLNQPVRIALLLLRSPRLMIIIGSIALSLMSIILFIYFAKSGFGLRVEGFLLVNPILRPFAQFAAFLGITVGSFALGRYEVRRERPMLIITMLLASVLFFYGARGFLLAVVQAPLLVWIMRRGRRIKLIYLFGILIAGFFASAILDAFRSMNLSLAKIVLGTGMAVAFGNSFSDTRDFALVLSTWDHAYLLGKTYLAGVMAFIPRFLSPFRDRWSYGVVTATMVGFDPSQHAGLRIGSYGEAYLNFGIPAVIVLGLIIGSVTRLIDMRVKECLVGTPSDVRVYSYMFLGTFVGVLSNSTGFSNLYTVLGLFVFCAFVVVLSRFIKLPLG